MTVALINPVTAQLAMTLAIEGIAFWKEFLQRAADGEISPEELEAAAETVGKNVAALRAEAAVKRNKQMLPTPKEGES